MLNEIQKPSVVSNTGPLISASQCDKIDLFKRYFDSIYIVQSQLEEFKRHQAEEWIQELIDEGFVKVVTKLFF
jgi:predicted nucleic acid-binding protein